MAEEKKDDGLKKIKSFDLRKLSGLEKFFYGKFWFRVPIFVVGLVLLRIIVGILLRDLPSVLFYVSFFLMTFLSFYLIFFIVFLVKHSIKSLLNAKNIWTLSLAYVMLVLSLIVLFSSAYSSSESMGQGYLTYGTCSDNFSPSMISADNLASHRYFYFSAITFFTVGYGDVCPMGWNKNIAIVNSFAGVFVNTIVMVIVISSYLRRKEE